MQIKFLFQQSFNLSNWLLIALFSMLSTSVFANDTDKNPKNDIANLTVYTYDSFITEWGPGSKLKPLFEEKCQCQITFVAAEDGVGILNRLRIEGEKTAADVIVGIDNVLMQSALEHGLIAPHEIDTSVIIDELNWQSEYFLPFDYGYFSFIYDSQSLSKPATSLQQLVDSDSKIIYQDPRTSTVGQGLLVWMNQVFANDIESAWQALSARTITVTKGWSEAYSIFLEGGADYVLSYHTSPAYHMVNDDTERYRAAHFTDGHIQQVEVAAVINKSDNAPLAKQFLAFLISPQAQHIIATHNWMLPVVPEVSLPAAFNQLITPNTLTWPQSSFADNRRKWLQTWRNVASQNN